MTFAVRWGSADMTEIQKDLFAMQDKAYQAFSASLVPTLAPDLVIGVRVPQLRQYAKHLSRVAAVQSEEYESYRITPEQKAYLRTLR